MTPKPGPWNRQQLKTAKHTAEWLCSYDRLRTFGAGVWRCGPLRGLLENSSAQCHRGRLEKPYCCRGSPAARESGLAILAETFPQLPSGGLRRKLDNPSGRCELPRSDGRRQKIVGRRGHAVPASLIPCLAALAVPFYNTIAPRLFGFPSSSGGQLLLIPLSALFILAAYLGERDDRHLNWTATYVFVGFSPLVTIIGFMQQDGSGRSRSTARVGPWRPPVRGLDQLVHDRRRPLHRIHGDRGAGPGLRGRGLWLLRRPYTIIIYPLLFVAFPRLWSVTHKRGYLTAGDFVLGRYGNRWLELAVALTGILATMPYIALQTGRHREGHPSAGFQGEGIMSHLPLTIAFVNSRSLHLQERFAAPAMIAFVRT